MSSCSKKTQQVFQLEEIWPDNTPNVMIASGGSMLGPCEPSICISPMNTNLIVAGSILNRVHVSTDGGQTWENSFLNSSLGVYGDPVVAIGPKQTIYYSHLSNPSGRAYASEDFLDRIVVQRSLDNGISWNDGTAPENDRSKDQDKQWLYVDPDDGEILMSWTEFDEYNSKKPGDRSRILFSKSQDDGLTWTKPVILSDEEGDCLDDDYTTEGAVPVKDGNGNILVSWAFDDKIYLDKSTDGGQSWMENDRVVATQFGGWALDIPGIMRCNGMPILGVDRSDGPHAGNLYINWSDQKNGTDDTDIWLIRSTDGGKSWSDRIRVNDDAPGKHQFFSWMDVDPVTGYVFIVFYDRRAYDDLRTDVYLAYSTDGGRSFINKKISESPFVPNDQVFFGDYNDISAFDGVVRPIWTRLDDGKLSVWTAIINLQKK